MLGRLFKKLNPYLPDRGEFPNRIRNRNRLFWQAADSESIRRLKNYQEDSLEQWKDCTYWQRKLSNKANSREFAEMHGCKLPDLYYKGADVENIDFSKLPVQYVIRPTVGHSSKMVFIMDKGLNLFDHKTYDFEQIRAILKNMVDSQPGLEILIEEFLQNENGTYGIQTDYKVFCFKGEVAAIWVINRESPSSGFSSCYDEHWNPIPMINGIYPFKAHQEKPSCFDEIVAQAKLLSLSYGIFVRIDFYATPKGAVFGEFTATPSMGKRFTRFGKKLLAEYWNKYCEGLV